MDPFFEEAADTPIERLRHSSLTFEGETEFLAAAAVAFNERHVGRSLQSPTIIVLGLVAMLLVAFSLAKLVL